MAKAEFSAKLDAKSVQKLLGVYRKNVKAVDERQERFNGLISSLVFRDIMRHFDEERGPDGKWKGWSDSYKDYLAGLIHFRKIKGRTVVLKGRDPDMGPIPERILRNTGRLRNAFTPSNYRRVKEGLEWFNPAKTKKGFPYAYAHDNDDAPRTRLPRRAFMWLSDDILKDIESQVLKFLES